MALDPLESFQESYSAADHDLKRQWNQALFTRFDVVDDEIAEPEFAEPFKTLATLQSTPSSRKSRNGGPSFSGHGSDKKLLVGETGFEPATARPPAECATRLRHSPLEVSAF